MVLGGLGLELSQLKCPVGTHEKSIQQVVFSWIRSDTGEDIARL